MKCAYDRNLAKRLVPLLEAISAEITDRMVQIELLERQYATLDAGPDSDRSRQEIMDLRAQLAVHNRELRLAKREVERLGCVVDETLPARILIPGRDGGLERGFHWDATDGTIRRTTNTSVG